MKTFESNASAVQREGPGMSRVNIVTPHCTSRNNSRAHLNPLGCSYALIAERHWTLPPGELAVLAWVLAARRATRCLHYTFQELAAATRYCGKTLDKHVHSLRQKGLIDGDKLKAAPAALTKKGERHAHVKVLDMMRDLDGQQSAAAFQLHVVERAYTDRSGRKRASDHWLARVLGCSLRTIGRRRALLRLFGFTVPAGLRRVAEKSVRSTRKKLSDMRKKVADTHEGLSVEHSRQGASTPESRGNTLRRLRLPDRIAAMRAATSA